MGWFGWTEIDTSGPRMPATVGPSSDSSAIKSLKRAPMIAGDGNWES